MFIIPKNFYQTSLREKAQYLLFSSYFLLFVIGYITLDIIYKIWDLIKNVLDEFDPKKINTMNSQLSQLKKQKRTLKNQIQLLEKNKEQRIQHLKQLRMQISLERDYILLSNQNKDTSYLEDYRTQLDKNWNLYIEEDKDKSDEDKDRSEPEM